MLDSTEVTDLHFLGRRIAKGRKEKHWSQARLSAFCGVSRQRISQMENGSFQGRITDVLKVLHALSLRLEASARAIQTKEVPVEASQIQEKPFSKLMQHAENRYEETQKEEPHLHTKQEPERHKERMSGIMQHFRDRFESPQPEEFSLQEYLETLCRQPERSWKENHLLDAIKKSNYVAELFKDRYTTTTFQETNRLIHLVSYSPNSAMDARTLKTYVSNFLEPLQPWKAPSPLERHKAYQSYLHSITNPRESLSV